MPKVVASAVLRIPRYRPVPDFAVWCGTGTVRRCRPVKHTPQLDTVMMRLHPQGVVFRKLFGICSCGRGNTSTLDGTTLATVMASSAVSIFSSQGVPAMNE